MKAIFTGKLHINEVSLTNLIPHITENHCQTYIHFLFEISHKGVVINKAKFSSFKNLTFILAPGKTDTFDTDKSNNTNNTKNTTNNNYDNLYGAIPISRHLTNN